MVHFRTAESYLWAELGVRICHSGAPWPATPSSLQPCRAQQPHRPRVCSLNNLLLEVVALAWHDELILHLLPIPVFTHLWERGGTEQS